MRVAAVFRGFPGLGRVMAGMEILALLQKKFDAEIKLFTYLQGEEYAKAMGFASSAPDDLKDLCSIGIVPVNKYGESIIKFIESWPADLVVIDGEPLLVQTLRLINPTCKIIALLNPFDVENPHNTLSTRLFFNDCYSKSDIAVVHGLWKLEGIKGYNSLFSIPTILRSEIVNFQPNYSENRISCILGGGTERAYQSFMDATTEIGRLCMLAAKKLPGFNFDIYCGNTAIAENLLAINQYTNVRIHHVLGSVEDIYSNCKAVITRGGRNTLSELLYLGIPAIAFAASDPYRGSEQKTNLDAIRNLTNNIVTDLTTSTNEQVLADRLLSIIGTQQVKGHWVSGNEYIEKLIYNVVQ